MEKQGLSLKTKILIFSVVPMLGLLVWVMVNAGNENDTKKNRVEFQLPSNVNPSDTIENKETVYRNLERKISLQQGEDAKNKRVLINDLLNSTKKEHNESEEIKELSFEQRVDSMLRAREKNNALQEPKKKSTKVSHNFNQPKKKTVEPKTQPQEIKKEPPKEPVTEKQKSVNSHGFSSFQTANKNSGSADSKMSIEFYKATLYESKDIKKGQNTQVEFVLSEDCTIDGKNYAAKSILNGVAYYNNNGCDILVNSIKNRGEANPTPVTLYAYNERYQRGVYLISNLDNAMRKSGQDGIYEGSRQASEYNFVSRTIRNFGEAIVGGKDIPLSSGYTMYFSTKDQNQ